MVLSKQFFSVMGCAALLAIGSLGLSAVEAQAKPDKGNGNGNPTASTGGGSGGGGGGGGGGGQSIGTCSLTDVSLFSSSIGATQCANSEGNDNVNNFVAFGQTWNFLGKDEDGTIDLDPDGSGEVKSGEWFLEQDLKAIAESVVVVLKAGNYYSAYLFDDLADYSQAVNNGQFTVNGVTAGGKAGLSHMSIYYTPRLQEEKPPTIPEPVATLALLAVAGAGFKLKEQNNA